MILASLRGTFPDRYVAVAAVAAVAPVVAVVPNLLLSSFETSKDTPKTTWTVMNPWSFQR